MRADNSARRSSDPGCLISTSEPGAVSGLATKRSLKYYVSLWQWLICTDIMPICKKCGIRFPIYMTIDGKARNLCKRKFCLNCSPFGKHNTRNITLGDLGICRICGKKFAYNRSKGHRCIICNSCIIAEHRRKIKQRLVEYKGGKCEICGYSRCMAALDFHHIDPNEKDLSFSRGMTFSLDKFKKEADKCILLCANCHREIHNKGI